MNISEISIVIPVFNGADFIKDSLSVLRKWCDSQAPKTVEIIVVNDGSSDDTTKILSSQIKNFFDFKIIDLNANQGKGAAIRVGLQVATGEYIVYTDADLPYGVRVIDAMLREMKINPGLDFLYGSRTHFESGAEKGYGVVRKLGRLFFSRVVRGLVLSDIADTQCGIKMMRRSLAELVVTKSVVSRFAFDIELFVLAKSHHLGMKEFPVLLNHRKESSVRIIKDTVLMLLDIFLIKKRHRKGIYN